MSVLPEHVFLNHVCAWSQKKVEEDIGSSGQSVFRSSFWNLLTSCFTYMCIFSAVDIGQCFGISVIV